MKKLVAWILCIALLCLSIAALAEPATIEFVGLKSEVQEVMKAIIADFEAENPDIHVEYAYNPDGASGLASRIANGTTPDLMNIYPL